MQAILTRHGATLSFNNIDKVGPRRTHGFARRAGRTLGQVFLGIAVLGLKLLVSEAFHEALSY